MYTLWVTDSHKKIILGNHGTNGVMIQSNPNKTDSDVLNVTELAWDKYQ